ncbi:MAG: leucyl aminopeptidase family protein [Synechococcales cyanobacterium RU_4_20]|nr:leucyl aminopeptidase family protein [Synechococcales cyanobacterium RU_4_20]
MVLSNSAPSVSGSVPGAVVPLRFVQPEQLRGEYGDRQAWFEACQFSAKPGTHCLLPNLSPSSGGELEAVLIGRPKSFDVWSLAGLAQVLPPRVYGLSVELSAAEATALGLGWRLGQYRFDRYKQQDNSKNGDGSGNHNNGSSVPTLVLPQQTDSAYIEAATAATFLVRDLINTPVNDMGPAELEAAARALAAEHDMEISSIVGEALLGQNYPMIHAVGRASASPPRLIDLHWGPADAPKVTLVGKGVCFDTGGLNIKASAGMKLMKKDMGGAAQVLGLAKLIAMLQLPVRLRVLVAAVENSIDGNAVRPTDVMATRKGITVENNNTDAEGRLVLGDALWEASSEQPVLLVDCATLTGAARVALGTELPAVFCNDPDTAAALKAAGLRVDDPVWELPLHAPYRSMLESKVADLSNVSNGSFGGAITAGLFLQEFVQPGVKWIHVDFMAWNLRSLPGRPEGGEAMGMRALYELIRSHLL